MCIDGSCNCEPGFCASGGKCVLAAPTSPPTPIPTQSDHFTPAPTLEPFVPELAPPLCKSDTGGTCRIFGCYSSRGPAYCSSDYRCLCKEGHCANDGTCNQAFGTCKADTGGTCAVLGCYGSRGATECVDGRCLCQRDYCAVNGVCYTNASFLTANVVVGAIPQEHMGIKTAVAFSGGGSRSLSLTLGGLRALDSLGLLPKVDAISAVSGGAWATAIFMFARVPLPELLGPPAVPSELTLNKLGEKSSKLGWAATRSMWESSTSDNTMNAKQEERWGEFVASSLLQPFDLHKNQYMAANQAQVDKIIALNPSLEGEVFLMPVEGRPRVFVMGGTFLAPYGYSADGLDAMDLQMSPDYTGSKPLQQARYIDYGSAPVDKEIGGGFIESFAMGSKPGGRNGWLETKMKSPDTLFSLKKAVSISSAAFASGLNGDFGESLNPRLTYWPITPVDGEEGHRSSLEYEFGDGGNMENSGVLAMLQRGADHIIWFINTDTGITKDVDFCNDETPHTSADDFAGKVTNQVTDKFGFGTDDSSAGYLAHNQVFQNAELAPLLCDFQTLRTEGKPMVLKREHEVVANPTWTIPGGNKVTMLYVYNERSENFVKSLPADTSEEINDGDMFTGYPFFSTVHQVLGEFTAYTMEQVNLLAAQSEYFLLQNEGLVRDMFA